MRKKVTLIGAGPGGYVAAIRAAQLGGEVTVVEQERVGGTCLNWGCIPSKVMKTTADRMWDLARAPEFGIRLGGDAALDFDALSARRDRVVQDQAKGIRNILDHHKIRYVQGTAAVGENHIVEVRLTEGGTLEVPWDNLILAMGSSPLDLPLFPFDGEFVLSSNHVFGLQKIPGSLMIVGGGVIGCEFAMIFSAFGTRVTLVEALSRLLPLPSVDEACSKVLQREMKKRKIEFMVNRSVEKMDRTGGMCRVTIGPSTTVDNLKEKNKEPLIREVEKVLVCVGRKPNTEGMGLVKIGVRTDERGWVVVDGKMETSSPGVYAVGDVLGPSRPMLAHVASREGIVAAENIYGEQRIMRYDAVPGAVFTTPEVADVGLTEAQAHEKGYAVRTDSVLFRALGKAHVIGEIAGEAKVVSDRETGRILGVHIVGPHASDLIAEGALAVQTGCTVRDLARTIHAHPTLPEIMMEVSMKALDKSLHG